jgi:ABC-2 type transport system permease protein
LFSVAIFMPSLIDPAVFFYGPRYLACYPAWVFLAITAGAAGSALTLLLVRLLGVRRAQTLSQVVATLLGASVFLACQLPAIFLHNSTDRDRLLKLFGRLLEFPVVTLPARAGRADIGALVLTVLIASAAVVLTSALFSRTFITGLQNLSAIPSAGPRLRRHRWSEGLWTATFRKDLRLIARDPVLFARTLPQCIFILPLGIALGRWMGWRVVAPCGFIVGIQLSSALCSITIGGEECWDLIRMSPSSELRLRSAKIAAAMAVPMLIVLTISAALAAFGSLRLALLTFGISLACSAGCSWISFSSPILGPRGGLTRHRGFGAGQGNGDVSTQILLCLFFFFTGTGGLACAASGRYSLLSATLLSLALAGSAGCFAFVRLKAVVWTEDQPTP